MRDLIKKNRGVCRAELPRNAKGKEGVRKKQEKKRMEPTIRKENFLLIQFAFAIKKKKKKNKRFNVCRLCLRGKNENFYISSRKWVRTKC